MTSEETLPLKSSIPIHANHRMSRANNDNEALHASAQNAAEVGGGGTGDGVTCDEEIEWIGNGRFHWITVGVCGLANAADAVELLCISYIIPELDAIGDYEKTVLTAAVFLGMLIGGLLAGVMSDRIGRKPCLMASLAINAVFGVRA